MEGKTLTNEKRFYPLLVSSSGLETQNDAESEQVWNQLDRIPVTNKKILLSANIIQSLYGAEQKFRWEPYYSARLSYFVRELFFQNISQSEFYKAVEALFGKQYRNQFNEILSYINNVILTAQPDPDEPEDEEEPESLIPLVETKQHTLLDALSKYPNLSNQTITTERIILKSSREPVRPTLSNWLKNYRDELGIGRHDAVARAKFLFESQNTKKLPGQERDKIHMLVRSLEDDELLAIDTKKQEIVFPNEKKEEREEARPQTDNPANRAPSPDIFERFQNISEPSYPEELKNVGTPTFTRALPNQAQVATRGAANTEGEKKNEQTILARIKSMLVAAPKANAPAPKEDFSETVKAVQPGPIEEKEAESLGTLRFSAKHVLPRERQIREVPPIAEPPARETRLEHFRPEPVPIPGDPPTPSITRQQAPELRTPLSRPPTSVPIQASVLPASLREASSEGMPVTQAPSLPTSPIAGKEEKEEYVASNMFRIKPNRE